MKIKDLLRTQKEAKKQAPNVLEKLRKEAKTKEGKEKIEKALQRKYDELLGGGMPEIAVKLTINSIRKRIFKE